MTAQRVAFSLHFQQLPRTHLRNFVADSQLRNFTSKGRQTNSTITRKQTIRADQTVGDGTTCEAANPRRPREAGRLTRVLQPNENPRQRKPYLFQICTSLAIWFGADVLAQQIGGSDYDATQTGRMLIIGGSASIPMYKWFTFVSTRVKVGPGLPKTMNAILTAGVRTAATCCIMTPVMSTYFFSMQSILSGHSLASTWEHLQQTLPRSWESAFHYWPVVNAVNFSVVPTQLRGIFQAFAGLVWQTYLAWLNRRMMDLEEADKGRRQGMEEPMVMKSQASMPG